jgi:hypothetical protein
MVRLAFRGPDPCVGRQGKQLRGQPINHSLDKDLSQLVRLFARADEPVRDEQGEPVDEGPARQKSTRDLSFIAWRIWNCAAEPAPDDCLRKKGFGLLSGGVFDSRAACQITSEHQSVERWILDAVVDVGAQDRK